MKTKWLTVSALAPLFVVLFAAACNSPVATSTDGSLSIQVFNNVNAKSFLHVIDMAVASFTVSGSGPGGATFFRTTAGGEMTASNLTFGSWSVTVNALNAGGTIIGSGQATATVHTGVTTTVAISVVPLDGNGTLSLTVTWTASQVESPSIQATLTPPSGPAASLSFGVSGNHATYSSATIPAGYQTLTLQLLDNDIAVMGAVDVARIVAGQTTSGTYDFTNVNQPGGSVLVNITPEMADSIPTSISEVASTITAGTSFTATASVGDGTTNVVYVWYLNGVSQATGSIYTFGSTLAVGYYRLDVTAYSADGTRAGSATANFQVTPRVGNIVLYYAYTTNGGTWTRTSSPLTLTDGANTVSQSLNPTDGSVTLTIQNAPVGYEDNGFYFYVGSLQYFDSLRVVAANGAGSFSANLYLDVDNNGEFFTWASNVLAGLGADRYFFASASPVNGVLTIDSTTSFDSATSSGSYTLPQLRAGAIAGVSGNSRAAIWLGFSLGSGSQTTTIVSITEN